MENIKKLGALIDKATSDSHDQIPEPLRNQILELVNERVDMPKHAIAAISKRMVLKNRRVLLNVFTLLEFLGYKCELSLYSQISTKEFLFKISGLLMNKDVDPSVKDKILETIFCWEELFRPHEDLLPLFFQFYAGLLRNNFQIPHHYVSPFRPAKLKEYKKKEESTFSYGNSTKVPEQKVPSYGTEPTRSEQQVFEEIREKLILTNEIINQISPNENVKENGLLIEMIEQIKECEKKVNKTINENPSQRIMEMALAANDDIFITYRRFKDLQRNRKPEPFILTELTSDAIKEQESRIKKAKQQHRQTVSKPPPPPAKKEEVDILGLLDEAPAQKPQSPEKPKPKKEENLFDMDFDDAPTKKQQTKPAGGDVFDLLGQSNEDTKPQNPQSFTYDELLGTTQFNDVPGPSGNGISLNANDFRTDADMKPYNNQTTMEKLDDLAYEWLKKK